MNADKEPGHMLSATSAPRLKAALWRFARVHRALLISMVVMLALAAWDALPWVMLGGLFFLLAAACYIPLLAVHAIARKSAQAWLMLHKLLLLLPFWAALWGIAQWHQARAAQQGAQVLAQLEQWRAAHNGAWPRRSQEFAAKLPPQVYYWWSEERQTPNLMYRDRVLLFDSHVYDFEAKQWRYIPD